VIDNTKLVKAFESMVTALDSMVIDTDATMIVESPYRDVIVDYTIKVDTTMSYDDLQVAVTLYADMLGAVGLYIECHNIFNIHYTIMIALDGDYSDYPLSAWHM
jgi:hypothetical protein